MPGESMIEKRLRETEGVFVDCVNSSLDESLEGFLDFDA